MSREWIYQNYLSYLSEYHPKYHQIVMGNENLKSLFLLVNDLYVIGEVYQQDHFRTKNYFNLLNEFKIYTSRLMIILPLNDKYMLDAVLRLLVEKLYRMVYSLYCPLKTERNIRRQSREEMAKKKFQVMLRGKVT